MRDPENPNEKTEKPTESAYGTVILKSREENILWTLRNSVDTLSRYGIGRKNGKYFVVDKERLDGILEKEPELRDVLRKLWTEKV